MGDHAARLRGGVLPEEQALFARRSMSLLDVYVASCVYSRINAHYAAITDTDEIVLQHRLLKVMP